MDEDVTIYNHRFRMKEREKLLHYYEEISEEQLKEKIEEAKKELLETEDTYLFEELLQFANINTLEFAEIAFKEEIFKPAILYKDASPQIRDAYIQMLENDEADDVNAILIILAVIGDDVVYEAFKRWEKSPKKWRDSLFAGPNTYALEGGWCIDINNQKRELLYKECYALEVRDDYKEDEIVVGSVTKDKCSGCESSYTNALELDGRDERLKFLGIPGRIKVKHCSSCLPWEEWIFSKYQIDGDSEVINVENMVGAGEYVSDKQFEEVRRDYPLVISKKRVSNEFCSQFFHSAIGGRPSWISDAQYATCPECGNKMKHLAQLSSDDTGEGGNIYIQICTECQVTATCYQCT